MKTEITIIGSVILIAIAVFFYNRSLETRKDAVSASLEELDEKNAELAKYFENGTSPK